MRILGIDPGTAITGYAVIEVVGQKITVLDLGCIKTQKSQSQSEKLVEIANNLNELMDAWQPANVAVEKLFFSQNVTTAVTVAQARGVILETVERRQINCVEYLPREIKLAVCGSGSADKKSVQKMVKLIGNLQSLPKVDDAADALAVAICSSQHQHMDNIVKQYA